MRPIPSPALGWRVGSRVVARKSDAYYVIAKALVVAKYPALQRRQPKI